MSLFRTKPIAPNNNISSLKRCLSAFDLTLMGIGAIIGAGVFVLTGIAAATKAGPAITFSYILAGVASLLTALAYAELASSVGGSGSAYNYSYASFGEFAAWLIGWALLLEYTVSVATVAIGWSGYLVDALQTIHVIIPKAFTINHKQGGLINLPAVLVILCLTALLCAGVKHSARLNAIIVTIKLLAIALFISIAATHINPQNWHPFTPFGWQGISQGAAIVFFAYIGFDAVSTAAEECIDPQRSLPIGILSSVFICTVVYVVVSILLTGIAHYTALNVASPVSNALLQIGFPLAAALISVGAIAGLTTVMLVMFYGLTRIILAISRDGLLPACIAKVHPKTSTPVFIIILSGIVIAFIAGCVPLDEAASLVNIGTLSAFTLVCGGVIAMRFLHPDLPRPFKLPLNPLIPVLGMGFCIYLMLNLAAKTWEYFISWLVVGVIFYFIYSRRHSLLHNK